MVGASGLAALPGAAKELWADGLVTVLACPADAPPGVAASPSARPVVTRSIVYLAAASVQAGHPDATLHAAAAKAQVCADVAAAAADTALMLHGAIGYTWEHDLQIFYKRAKLDATLFGSVAAWNERIAAELPLLPTVRDQGGVAWSSS